MNTAICKFSCLPGVNHHENFFITPIVALPALSPRLCFEVHFCSNVASDLFASYMRLCIEIDNKRELIWTNAGSEPILAEASA